MSEQLKHRVLSLAWRTGMMISVVALSFVVDNATELQIPPYAVVFIGLIAGEISKYLNSQSITPNSV